MTKRYSAYLYPLQIDGYELVPVCFFIPNHRLYREAAWGAITTLLYPSAWDNDDNAPDETREAVAEYVSQSILESLAIGADCMNNLRLWQDEINPCLLMVSYDGGETAQIAFDYSLCVDPAPSGLPADTWLTQSIYQSYIGTWKAAGLPAFAPKLLNGTADVDDRDAALCYAAALWVDMVCNLEIERRSQTAVGARTIISIVTVVVGAVLAVIGTPALAVAGTAIMNAILQIGVTALSIIDIAVLQNQSARNEVACCLFDNMEGLEPNAANLATSLDACTPALTGDSETIRAALASIMATDDGQLSYVALVAEGYDIARLDVLPGCPCDIWAHDFLDGDAGDEWWTILPYNNPSSNECVGSYNGAGDRYDGCDAGAGFSHAILLKTEMAQTIITQVTLTGTGIGTRASANDGHFIYLDTELVASEDFGLSWTDEVTAWDGQKTVSVIRLTVAAALGTMTDGADSRITQIHIEGRGTDPFL